jgi:surface antigen
MRLDPLRANMFFALFAIILATIISSSSHAGPFGRTGDYGSFSSIYNKDVNAPRMGLDWAELREGGKAPFASLRKRLRRADQYAALYALQVALDNVGDGQTYVWGRPKRQLRAFITPLGSFRSKKGNICRQLIFSLSLGTYMKRIETTACRASDKRWVLQG